MPSLRREEAHQRAHLLYVDSYSVDLDLTRGEEVFGSSTVIRFGCREPGATTFIELRPVTVHRAVLNGRLLEPTSLADGRLPLPDLAADNELRVEADMRYSRTGEGMHRFVDPADDEVYVHADCGPDQASHVFACFDQPDLKAVLQVSVTAPAHWTVLANGAAEHGADGRWRFVPTRPISTYLMTVVGGPMHSVRTEHDGIPLGLHCRRSLAPYLDAEAEEILDITRRGLDRYHELFDERYPFGKYDQAFVPESNFGAVENVACVNFRDEFLFRSPVTDTDREIRAVVIAHELAHMWFGDLVTMRWWDDIWLSESFAEYMGQRVATDSGRFASAWAGFAVNRKTWGYDADQRPSTHPVASDGIDDTAAALAYFDGISYAKGASALRQLVEWVGDEAFLAGVNDLFSRHRFGNADLADLLAALARTGGRDVHAWAQRWLRTSGMDTLRTSVEQRDGTLLSAEIVHTGPPGDDTGLRPHRIRVGLYDLAEGAGGTRLMLRETVDADLPPEPGPDGSAHTPLPSLTGARVPDLLLPNDGDVTYAKIRLDERSWQAVTVALSTIEDQVTRALLWTTARDMVRDAELPPTDFLALARSHLVTEPVGPIVEAVLSFARRQIADRLVPLSGREAALATLAAICRRIMRRAEGDPSLAGMRLAAVRFLITCATTADNLAELREWLRAGRVPGGPGLYPQLRWSALFQLFAAGMAGEAQLAAELVRDPSSAGREAAARCRAALPDAAAKERAWQRLFTANGQSNQLLAATADGFWDPGRPDATSRYVERYFAEIADAGPRGAVASRVLAGQLFPAHAVNAETVRAAEKCLDHDLTAPLRRALTDQLDDLRRALRIRAAD
ncbi:aminopeptidase N [Actinomadura sp. HBU206391]|uniref:aminopeptidase N n=1 Tax=Actinomadura sp. HBU206391 TaxID=2731692 RepID=UPI001650CDE9|nr:aminopeptidase N [Actinomadura sp. HBU206391]MBC6456338.1 aminopeptidase N [Actinomadura sp. HBU206391]